MYKNRGRGRFNKNDCDFNPLNRNNRNSCSFIGNRYKLAFMIVTDAWFLLNLTLMLNAMFMSDTGNPHDFFYPFSSSPQSGFWAYDFSEFISYGIVFPLLAQITFSMYALKASLAKQSTVTYLWMIILCILSFGLVTPMEDIALRSQYLIILSVITTILFILIVADMVYFRSRSNY